MKIELMQEPRETGLGGRSLSLWRIVQAEEYSFRPSREQQSTKGRLRRATQSRLLLREALREFPRWCRRRHLVSIRFPVAESACFRDFPHRPNPPCGPSVRLAHFVNFGASCGRKREYTVTQESAGSLRNKESQAFDRAMLHVVSRAIQPQSSKGKKAFHGGSAQPREPSCVMPRTCNPENESSRSRAAVSESATACGKRSLRMRSKRTRNCSRVILPAARGESVRRNSRRPGFVRPNFCTSRTMRSSAHSFTRSTRRVRLRSSDPKGTSAGFPLRLARSSAAQSPAGAFKAHPPVVARQVRSVRNYSKVRPVTFMDGYC
jgi:hypothetical protein